MKSILIVLLIGLTTAVAVVSLLLTLVLPTLLRRFACAPYGIRCAVGQAKLHPHPNLTSDLVIQDLTVFEQDGRGVVIHAKRLAVTLDFPTMIRTRRAMVTELRIDSPELLLRRLEDGRWNLLALAQEVRQHLRPTTSVTPVQLPRISLNAGAFHIGARRVTDVNVTLEPKPGPLLFEVRVRAAVEGRPIQVTGVVGESFEGELQAQAKEVLLDGATQAWKPRAAVKFRFDLAARALNIPEWALELEDDGAMARGAAAIRYAEWPLTYELTVAAWRANLRALAERFPLPSFSDVSGNVQGEPFALKGQWPQLPVASVTATLTDTGFQLPKHQFRLMGFGGICRVQYSGGRLHLQADLRGEAVAMPGERHANPTLSAILSADMKNGDVAVEGLRASVSGARIVAKGSGRRWGREGLDLTTRELMVEPAILNRLLHRTPEGLAIKAVQRPSIHVRWPGGDRPWAVEIVSRSVQLASATAGYSVALQEPAIALQGMATSLSNLQGTVTIRQLELAGRKISALMTRFEIHPDRIQIPMLRFVAEDGSIRGHASFSRPSPLNSAQVTLSVNGLQTRQLLPATLKATEALGIALDAEVSAALSNGHLMATIDLPPPVTRQFADLLHQTARMARANAADAHLIVRVQGTLQTTKGVQASGSLSVQGLHALLADGVPASRELPAALSIDYRDGLLTLKAQELAFTAVELTSLLSRVAGGRILGKDGSLVISAEAAIGGSRPPTGHGAIALRKLSFDLARPEAASIPLLRGLQGSLAFTLDKGRLGIKETGLRADGGLTVIVSSSVPLGGSGGGLPAFRLVVPWTDASPLLSPMAALVPGGLADARLAGQVRADLEMTGQTYHGTIALRDVNMESHLVRLQGMNGTIPLAGRMGQPIPANHASSAEWIGWSLLSEDAYKVGLENWRKGAARGKGPYSLVIATLRYGPIELREFDASLAPSGDQITIQRFAFQVWGGSAGGWGRIQPLGGGLALALLVDGVSLRAICDAFPPIKGYISGRINGLADLFLPSFALEKAQGEARFWAVDSRQEPREISRILIEKLAGARIRYFSLFGEDRRYDRGILDVALSANTLIFHELDISHTTLGIVKDLDIRVSPTFNKIAVAHLLDSIKKAVERVKASGKQQP